MLEPTTTASADFVTWLTSDADFIPNPTATGILVCFFISVTAESIEPALAYFVPVTPLTAT